MPFTEAQFIKIFAEYNTGVWPAQIALNALALTAVLLLWRGGGASLPAAGILSALWLWTGLVYHLGYFSAINPAALWFGWAFVLEGVIILVLGLLRGRLVFGRPEGTRLALGWGMVVYALLIYPILGYLLGHSYPGAPTFGAPCPLVIFTFGLLLWTVRPVPWPALVVPVLWAVVGTSAALNFGMWEDLALPLAALATLVYVIRDPLRRPPGEAKEALPG